jgi:hypothetical protein
MDETGATVFLPGVDCAGIVDMKAPLAWVLSEPLNKGRYDGVRDGFDGCTLEWEGVREELPTEEQGILRQKGDIDPRKLYHPWGKLGTLTARRKGCELLSNEALLSFSSNTDMSFGRRYGHT